MVKVQTDFEYFVYIIFGPLVLLLGLFGNSMGLVLLKRKNLEKLEPKKMYQCLFIIDLVCLLTVLNNHLVQSFDIGFSILSQFTCKFYMYFAYTFSPLTPMILFYILVERYLSVKYPVESNLLRKKICQLIYISVIIGMNLIFFAHIPFMSNLKYETNHINASTTNRTLCKIVSSTRMSSFLAFISRIFVLFTLIVLFSIMLVLKKSHVNILF